MPKVTILKRSGSAHWRVPEELSYDIRAGGLAAMVGEAIASHLREAAEAGLDPATLAPHPPLDPKGTQGRRAARGRRPRARGHTGRPGGFTRSIAVSKTKRRGAADTAASVTITARANPTWLEQEASRGVSYFRLDGYTQTVIDEAMMKWLDEITKK